MPSLTWPSKSIPSLNPAELLLDSVLFPQGVGYPSTPPANKLILGNNLQVMAALLPEYENCIDLIYADPPFFTNKHFPARIGRGEDSRRPREWRMAVGYGDHWENLDSYLDFLYPRLALMHRLLSPSGTLYLHLDWHAAAYGRLLLDELFGQDRLLNEIIWTYHGPSPIRRAFNRKHDTILAYTKSEKYTFNTDAVRQPYHPNTVRTFAASARAGFGKVPNLERGKVPEDWWYFPVVARLHSERTGYPTQKPEALVERIILASSNPGDLVADFFCGSGTFPLVAARKGRRFLGVDESWRAVRTTRSRMVGSGCAPVSFLRDASTLIPVLTPSYSFKMQGSTCLIDLSLPNDIRLDYWEIDPNWDGLNFRSFSQAVLPNRDDAIPLEIKMPAAPINLCMRAVTINGEQVQLNIHPVANPPDCLNEPGSIRIRLNGMP
jgi:site-specific DNA-methyltransferase (adenine-specific)